MENEQTAAVTLLASPDLNGSSSGCYVHVLRKKLSASCHFTVLISCLLKIISYIRGASMRDERNSCLQKLPKVRWTIEVICSERERGSGLHFSFCINAIIGLIFHFTLWARRKVRTASGKPSRLSSVFFPCASTIRLYFRGHMHDDWNIVRAFSGPSNVIFSRYFHRWQSMVLLPHAQKVRK